MHPKKVAHPFLRTSHVWRGGQLREWAVTGACHFGLCLLMSLSLALSNLVKSPKMLRKAERERVHVRKKQKCCVKMGLEAGRPWRANSGPTTCSLLGLEFSSSLSLYTLVSYLNNEDVWVSTWQDNISLTHWNLPLVNRSWKSHVPSLFMCNKDERRWSTPFYSRCRKCKNCKRNKKNLFFFLPQNPITVHVKIKQAIRLFSTRI